MTIKTWYKNCCRKLREDPLGRMDWYGTSDKWMFIIDTVFDIFVVGLVAYGAVCVIDGMNNPVINFIALAAAAIVVCWFLCGVIDIVRDTILLRMYKKHQDLIEKIQQEEDEACEKLEALKAEQEQALDEEKREEDAAMDQLRVSSPKHITKDDGKVMTEVELVNLCDQAIRNYNSLGSFLKDPSEIAQKTVHDWIGVEDPIKVVKE